MVVAGSKDIAQQALSDLRSGHPIVVADDGFCHLVMLAAKSSVSTTAFLIRHGSGFLVAVMDSATLARLEVPPMVGGDPSGPAFYVSVDAAEGISTGISATDRARTLSLLAAPDAGPSDLIRPGHVVTARVDLDRGPDGRTSHSSAAMVCAVAAGAGAVAATVALESVYTPGTATAAEGLAFAREHRLEYLFGHHITMLWYQQHTIGMEQTITG